MGADADVWEERKQVKREMTRHIGGDKGQVRHVTCVMTRGVQPVWKRNKEIRSESG